jgi:hypothetical protein
MNNRRMRHLSLWCALLLLTALLGSFTPTASAQTEARYFGETGHYIRGAFRSFWERNGGLERFGFPLTEEYVRRSDGKIVQVFERARFELSQGGPNPVVDLGLIGIEATGNRIFPQIPPFAVPPGRRYFPETLHTLMGLFRTTWETRGGVGFFGYPISEEIYERLEDGQFRLVQYFQRARFELWPEGVRFGRLGAFIVPPQLTDPWPPGIAPPGPLDEDGNPRPPPSPLFPNAGRARVQVNPFAGRPGTEFAIFGEGFQPGEPVIFWLTSPDGTVTTLSFVATADPNGSITPSQPGFDTGRRDLEGIWYVSAQGLRSGRIGIASFILNSDLQPGPNNPTGFANVRVSPDRGDGSTVFRLLADGFRPRENVSVWLTAPDGSVRAVSTALTADRNGLINDDGFPFSLGAGVQGGTWALTAQGQASGLQGIARFEVAGPTSGTGQVPASPLANIIHEALGYRNGGAPFTPLATVPGGSVRYAQSGFNPGEPVQLQLFMANGAQEEASASGSTADGAGLLSVVISPRNPVEGDVRLVARGVNSGRTFEARFKLTRDYIAPPGTPRPPSANGNVTPAEGGRSTIFQFTGTGFRANEPIDHWITAPDGIYLLVGRTNADGNGRIGFTRSLTVQFGERNPPGVYGYHYLGVNSRNRVALYLTYTGAP